MNQFMPLYKAEKFFNQKEQTLAHPLQKLTLINFFILTIGDWFYVIRPKKAQTDCDSEQDC